MVKRKAASECSARKPHFFKVLLGDFQRRLRIPTKFMKYISEEASQKAILWGPNRNSWQVKLQRTTNGAFLSTGWPSFVKHHSLKEFEFLVFRYEGSMNFTIQMFDTSACEREDLFPTKASPCEVKAKRGRPAKHHKGVDCNTQLQSCKLELSAPSKVLADDEPAVNNKQGRCTSSPKSSSNAKIKTEDDALPVQSFHHGNRTVYLSRRRPVTAAERTRAEEAANNFSSDFPHAILRMTMLNVYKTYTIRFPTSFSRVYLPRKRTNMVLRDPTDKAWVVVYIPGIRDCLSAGWSAFVHGNNLEEGDFCAFELLGPIEFRVHIFRVVEEITPLVKARKKEL